MMIDQRNEGTTMDMQVRRGGRRLILLGVLLPLLGCSDREEERQSLREQLARLPRDTTTQVEEEVTADPAPVDSSLGGLPAAASLPDTFSFLDGPEPLPIEPDTTPRGLRPGPPVDTAPWIPASGPLVLGPEWSTEPSASEADRARTAVLESVRTARNDGFDRIVFEFEGGRVPGYRIEYAELPVRQCGSGQVVPLRGTSWLRLRLEPSQAHDDRGRPTVQDRSRVTDLPVLRELRLICDYEGQVEWVMGTSEVRPYRIVELTAPARIVVDVAH